MNKGKVEDSNYYTVQGWMINRLGLKGIQLSLYAIIYGFSQGGENEYRGRIQYLCEFTGGTSKPTVINALKELVEKGYLQKREEVINGVLFVRYRAIRPSEEGGKEILPPVKKFNGGSKEILPTPGKEILPPTLQNNNTNFDIDRGKEPTEQLVDLYNRTCPSLPPVEYITENRTVAVKELSKTFTMEQMLQCFRIAESSKFLNGQNPRRWKATFDWLTNPDNVAKVLEGNFTDDNGQASSSFDTDEFFKAALESSYWEKEAQ